MWLRIISAPALTLLCAFAMSGGSQDTNYIPDNPLGIAGGGASYGFNTSWRDTSSKTLRANQSASSYSSCPFIIWAGQSNEGGEAATNYTPTNASVIHNFNAFDGALYAPADPPLGSTSFIPIGSASGSVVFRLADALINSGPATCVIIAPIAVGGTAIADWAPGGSLYPRLKNTINRANGRGFTTQYVIWGQGERDCNLGTTQANYLTTGNALFSDLQNSVAKIFIAEQTAQSGATCAGIETVQTSISPTGLINHSASPPIWAGPNNDALLGNVCSGGTACRQGDNTHFTDNGNITRAANWQAALHASGSPF